MLEQVVVSGLTLGAIYALIAIGFTIVFSTVRVVDAHGELAMASGVPAAWLSVVHGIPVGAAIPLAIARCVVLAWLSYELCLAGMNKDNHIAQVMVTLGLGITIRVSRRSSSARTQFRPRSVRGAVRDRLGLDRAAIDLDRRIAGSDAGALVGAAAEDAGRQGHAGGRHQPLRGRAHGHLSSGPRSSPSRSRA
jgi:branched-subunit amino acid ABC-type transport system permease component